MFLSQAVARIEHGTYGCVEVLACLIFAEHEIDGQLAVSADENCLVLLD